MKDKIIRASFEVRELEWESFRKKCKELGFSRGTLLRLFIRSVPRGSTLFKDGFIELIFEKPPAKP